MKTDIEWYGIAFGRQQGETVQVHVERLYRLFVQARSKGGRSREAVQWLRPYDEQNRVAAPTSPNNSEAPRRYVQDALEGRPVGTVVGNSYRVAAPTPETPSPEISRVVCKRCGCAIDCGLCSFACPLDDTLISQRDPNDVEVRVYALVRTEPLAGAVSHPQPDPRTTNDDDDQSRVAPLNDCVDGQELPQSNERE